MSWVYCWWQLLVLRDGVGGGGRGWGGTVRSVDVCAKVVRCQVRVGVCGSIFISGCQEGDTLMNGAE